MNAIARSTRERNGKNSNKKLTETKNLTEQRHNKVRDESKVNENSKTDDDAEEVEVFNKVKRYYDHSYHSRLIRQVFHKMKHNINLIVKHFAVKRRENRKFHSPLSSLR